MTKPNIVLFCENDHFDKIALVAEEFVVDKLDKSKWTHSLIEYHYILNDHKNKMNTNILRFEKADYLTRFTLKDTCMAHDDQFNIRNKFKYGFISHDVDSKEIQENFFSEADESYHKSLCPHLDKMEKALTDSSFFSIFFQYVFKSAPLFEYRNSEMVKNLEKYSYEVGNNYTTGWLGEAHCMDYNNFLVKNNSPLLDKTLFLSINTECSATYELMLRSSIEEELYNIKNHRFESCFADSRVKNFIEKGLSLLELAIPYDPVLMVAKNLEEYYKSPSVLHVNVSMSGEESTIFPWQVADLDIFN